MRKYRRVITHIHYLQIRNSKSRLACVLVGPCVTFMDPQYITRSKIKMKIEDVLVSVRSLSAPYASVSRRRSCV